MNINVRMLLLRTVIMGLFSGIYGVIFNLYVLDMGYRADFLGLLLSVTLLTSSAMSIPAGVLCDRLDRRKLMIVSSALSVACILPVFVLSSPFALLLFSALYGVFSSISGVCLTPILADNTDGETVPVFSANASLGWVATVAGNAFGGILPGLWARYCADLSSYRLTLLCALALLGLSCGVLVLLRAGKPRPHHRRPRQLRLADLRPSPTILKFTVASVTFGVASGMIVPYFNIYFMKVLNMGVLEIGLTSAVAGAVMIVGLMGTPLLTAKIGKVRSAVASKLLTVPFLVFMAITTDMALAAVAYVAYMFLINLAGPATTSFQMEQIPRRQQGFAVGLMSTGNCLAVAASSFAAGVLIAGGNFLVPFLLTCAGYAATAALLYHYFRDVEPAGREVRRRSRAPLGARAPIVAPAILLTNVPEGPRALTPLPLERAEGPQRRAADR